MNFGLLMLEIKLAVGQWTIDMAVTALVAALVLRVKRYRVRLEHVPAAVQRIDAAEDRKETNAGQDAVETDQETETPETYSLSTSPA